MRIRFGGLLATLLILTTLCGGSGCTVYTGGYAPGPDRTVIRYKDGVETSRTEVYDSWRSEQAYRRDFRYRYGR